MHKWFLIIDCKHHYSTYDKFWIEKFQLILKYADDRWIVKHKAGDIHIVNTVNSSMKRPKQTSRACPLICDLWAPNPLLNI